VTAVDHCVIAVSDWERSNAFRDVLGAELVERGVVELIAYGPC
jgi:catechol 2,3-dioxygenase-like lactoylglutathione lyase family enzyme